LYLVTVFFSVSTASEKHTCRLIEEWLEWVSSYDGIGVQRIIASILMEEWRLKPSR